MRKLIFGAAAMTLLALSACSNGNGSCAADKNCGDCKKGDKEAVYTGVLPAADVDGIRYTLKLDYDDDNNYTDGDYDLVEVYFVGDSTSATGYKDSARFKSEGDFKVINGTGDNASKKYIKLVQDVKDSSAGSNADVMYFLVQSDSTLVMVNSDLQESTTPGLNYTLKLVK